MERQFKFECACGQHLVARESMRGSQVYCPCCRRAITIPPGGQAIDEAQYERAERYTVACSCGWQMLVKAEAAGATIHCSHCMKPIRVPSLDLLRSSRTPTLETSEFHRNQIDTEDLLLLVDDDEGPGTEIK